MSKLVLEFNFNDTREEGYVDHELYNIRVLHQKEIDLNALAENWSQSDFFSVDIVNGIIEALDASDGVWKVPGKKKNM